MSRTGNQITEPAFSEDEMEFISDEKIKTDHKAGKWWKRI